MEDRLKKLERIVPQQGFIIHILLVLVILDTAGMLVLWGERGKPDFDHIAVSLTVFQTMFAIAALYGFWALRGLTKEKAEETAKEETAKIVPPIANRAIAEFIATLGGERTISDEDLANLVKAAGKEDDNGKSEMSIVARHLASAPVDLEAIFKELGITYEERWMDDGASGSLARSGENFIVTVNALESTNRQRFTAAHELAHYLLHRDLMDDGKKMQRHVDTLFGGGEQAGDVIFKRSHEIEANRIAAQIVMPKKLVEQEFEKTPDAGALAKLFGVSKAAMEIRLKTLGLAA